MCLKGSLSDLSISFRTISAIGAKNLLPCNTYLTILIDYQFRIYETVQMHFVKDATSAGTDEFCQGVFYDVNHLGLKILIPFQINRLQSGFKQVCHSFENFNLDVIVYLGLTGSKILVTSAPVMIPRSTEMVVISLLGSHEDFPTTYFAFFAFCTSLASSVQEAWIF